MASIGDIIQRTYGNFAGVDFLNPANEVALNRSPDSKNVWKSYDTVEANIIQTRPGYTKIAEFEARINAILVISQSKALVHSGTKLWLYNNFPSEAEKTLLFEDMNNTESNMMIFNDAIYIIDGKNYLKFSNNRVYNVAEDAYVPTTTISRSPSGGGENYEDVNLLTGKRINTFYADGTSKNYYLDATNINSVDKVIVNDEEVTNYTVDLVGGVVNFETAPEKSSGLMGKDNVSIEFTRNVSGYATRISNCQISTIFDNRIFFTGNPEYPNAVFHCKIGNPAYCSDLNYYECGNSNNSIKSLVVGNNVLWIFKEDDQEKDTIFYMTPTTDANFGRVYPTSQGNVSVGCYSKGINFKDNIVFFSKQGLEGISGSINYEQSITHKSSMVDSRLINESNYGYLTLAEYEGYLFVSIDNRIYIADSRQLFNGITGKEFEWYYWEMPVQISCIRNYFRDLYFGDSNGNLYKLGGTNDDGEIIEAYWTTPRDAFGYMNHYKKMNKRGSILKLKSMENGKLKIAVSTNKEPKYEFIKEVATSGFSFETFSFEDLTFETGDNSYKVFRVKKKKIIDLSLKIYTDVLNKPFGLTAIKMEAFLSGYVKR